MMLMLIDTSLKNGTEWRKKRLIPFCLIFQMKFINRSCTYFSTEFPWNLHTLWQILTIIFQRVS